VAPDLFADFATFFDLSLALTTEQRRKVYEIRYRVYCEEFGYEPSERFLDARERDAYDARSLHCLVTHRSTGMPAGCVRLVLSSATEKLPMETHTGDAIDAGFMAGFAGRRQEMSEFSRLAVDAAFRRRHGERATRYGAVEGFSFSEGEMRTFPLIATALFLGAAAVADLNGRKHIFAIMEPFLPRRLKRVGIDFRRIGSDFEFRGTRAPYYANIDELAAAAEAPMLAAFDLIKGHLRKQLEDTSPTGTAFAGGATVAS
jgi:N-acyl amino acid synthase of PEP-CTERM/exosortase system